jgi:hypothetical protein
MLNFLRQHEMTVPTIVGHVDDLFMSKAEAVRDKDRALCLALLVHAYIKAAQMLEIVTVLMTAKVFTCICTVRIYANTHLA